MRPRACRQRHVIGRAEACWLWHAWPLHGLRLCGGGTWRWCSCGGARRALWCFRALLVRGLRLGISSAAFALPCACRLRTVGWLVVVSLGGNVRRCRCSHTCAWHRQCGGWHRRSVAPCVCRQRHEVCWRVVRCVRRVWVRHRCRQLVGVWWRRGVCVRLLLLRRCCRQRCEAGPDADRRVAIARPVSAAGARTASAAAALQLYPDPPHARALSFLTFF
jgi:hypothetical protein